MVADGLDISFYCRRNINSWRSQFYTTSVQWGHTNLEKQDGVAFLARTKLCYEYFDWPTWVLKLFFVSATLRNAQGPQTTYSLQISRKRNGETLGYEALQFILWIIPFNLRKLGATHLNEYRHHVLWEDRHWLLERMNFGVRSELLIRYECST